MRLKSAALCERFIERVEWFAADHELVLARARALIAEGVVGDFRAPHILRFGFNLLALSYEQVLDASVVFERIMASGAWRSQSNARTGGVTYEYVACASCSGATKRVNPASRRFS